MRDRGNVLWQNPIIDLPLLRGGFVASIADKNVNYGLYSIETTTVHQFYRGDANKRANSFDRYGNHRLHPVVISHVDIVGFES